MTPATARFYEAIVNGQLTHSGDSRLAWHVGNAILGEDSRGPTRQETKDNSRRTDAAVAAVTAVHHAAELAGAGRLDIYI
jgi:phage terminase large subunit-like protein